MEGVTILNELKVVTETAFSWSNFWLGLGIGSVVAIIFAIVLGLSEGEWKAFFVVCAILIPLLGGWTATLGGACIREEVSWETQYEVIIDETVSMQEFMSRYEIVETRGEIYTVIEK